jgi:hypothetical protein
LFVGVHGRLLGKDQWSWLSPPQDFARPFEPAPTFSFAVAPRVKVPLMPYRLLSYPVLSRFPPSGKRRANRRQIKSGVATVWPTPWWQPILRHAGGAHSNRAIGCRTSNRSIA